MKMTRILLLLVLSAAIFSCSKDDDPTPASSSLETAALSLSSESKVISPPSAMAASNDTYAQMATGYVSTVNGLTNYLAYFKPPSGAVKSSAAITAANGRVASTQKTYLVYTWTDPTYGSFAYQVSEETDKYVFEIFLKQKTGGSWLRYVYAEESKDQSAGLMKIYDLFTGAPTTTILLNYSWKRTGDILEFTMEDPDPDFSVKIIISINEKTKAGSVVYIIDSVKWYEMKWDAKGSGSWTWYEDDGITVSDSGTWTV